MEMKNKSMEFRGEKVRNIIGQVPSALVRNGTLIICIVSLVLFIMSIFIPYRETIPLFVKFETYPDAHFVHSSISGFFVSDSIPRMINKNSIIGQIINEGTVENITSPIKGNVLMNIKKEEYLNKGELICVIIPENYIFYGIAEISIENYYKVKEGNKIIMSLNENKTVSGTVEKIHYLSYNQNLYKIKIRFEENELQDKLYIGTVHSGRVILSDVSILKKFALSIGVKM